MAKANKQYKEHCDGIKYNINSAILNAEIFLAQMRLQKFWFDDKEFLDYYFIMEYFKEAKLHIKSLEDIETSIRAIVGDEEFDRKPFEIKQEG